MAKKLFNTLPYETSHAGDHARFCIAGTQHIDVIFISADKMGWESPFGLGECEGGAGERASERASGAVFSIFVKQPSCAAGERTGEKKGRDDRTPNTPL